MSVRISRGLKSLIWLAHTYGAVKFRSLSVRLMWEPSDRCVLIDTATHQIRVAQERGFIERVNGSDGLFVLTAMGRLKADRMRCPPARLAEARCSTSAFWLSDEQAATLSRLLDNFQPYHRQWISGIVHALRENLSFRQVAGERYGTERVLRHSWARWCASGVMDTLLGHLFERDASGTLRLAVSTEILLRHRRGLSAIVRGELPTFSPIDELEAA